MSNQREYGIPLLVVTYEELYGWSMDKIVRTIGRKGNCTFCGVFRRQALERGALMYKADKMVTGHNADDVAETVIMNMLRGDVARLGRCVEIVTKTGEGGVPRARPFKYTHEKEIVMYAHFKQLEYFSTECTYAPGSFRGYARTYLKDLERVRPQCILDIIHSAEQFQFKQTVRLPKMRTCTLCGFQSSKAVCKACMLLEELRQRSGQGGGKQEIELEIEQERRDSEAKIEKKGHTYISKNSITHQCGCQSGGQCASSGKGKRKSSQDADYLLRNDINMDGAGTVTGFDEGKRADDGDGDMKESDIAHSSTPILDSLSHGQPSSTSDQEEYTKSFQSLVNGLREAGDDR